MASSDQEIIARQRAMWAAGDYADIATSIEAVAEWTVEAARVAAGDAVLDVATGTGNAALAAARRGAEVTAMDLTPELLEIARGRAAEEGMEIAFGEGNAEELPYDDEEFDVVTSVFGAMFAPKQAATAAELLRVTRPGGTIAVTAWTPAGLNGQMFVAMGRHMPPPPPGFQPPILWGVEDHVRGLFGAAAVVTDRRRATDSVQSESAEGWVDYLERMLGPVAVAKRVLEPQGRWPAARADLVALYEDGNEAEDGTLRASPEYLLTLVRKPG
jgi:SAM-dependent methyltransferase